MSNFRNIYTPVSYNSSNNKPSLITLSSGMCISLVYSVVHASNVSVLQCYSLSTIPACLLPHLSVSFSLSGTPLILSQIQRFCSASPQTLGLSPRQQSWTVSTSSGTISPSSPHKEVLAGFHLSHTVLKYLTKG